VIHDFKAGSFQPAEEPIKRKYTGVASWVNVSEDLDRPKCFKFTPRLDYFRLWVEVTHTLKAGVSIVMIQITFEHDHSRIFLDEIGSKMQQFVDAANGKIQEVSDTLLLKAPDQGRYHMTTAVPGAFPSFSSPSFAVGDILPIVIGDLPTIIGVAEAEDSSSGDDWPETEDSSSSQSMDHPTPNPTKKTEPEDTDMQENSDRE